jgi:sarcosine oxidase subunit alpha
VENIEESNIPVYLDAHITKARGSGKVETVWIEQGEKEKVFDVDLVCIAGGLSPILEPFEILGCELTYQKELGGWLPMYDANLKTSNHSIYVAGNAAGITCMGGILATGGLAGIGVLESLGVLKGETCEYRKQQLWNELYQVESSQPEDLFDARLAVIKNSCLASGEPLPKTLDLLLEGR